MKKWLWILIIATILCTASAIYGGGECIVICSSLEQFRGEALQQQLKEKFPQKNMIVTYMPTGKAASKIYAEGEKTEVDILVGLETGYLNQISSYLGDISGISQIPYLDSFGPGENDNKWVTWEKQAGAIVVNTEILEKHGLDAPSCYEDLLDPKYKNLVVMPDPKSSGTGYFFYKSWVNTMGREKALEYVEKLHENLKTFTDSGSGPIKMLKQGEAAIGLALTFQAVSERNAGQPFEIIFPETGSPFSLTGTSIINGREQDPDIKEVYSFIANDFLVYDKENFSPEQIYENQLNHIPGYPADIPYADMTGIQDDVEKKQLLSIWPY